jgi:DNA (cytosine-5)-methyltransferase 1
MLKMVNNMREITVDLFAGGGGASTGIEQALGMPVDIAINHDPELMEVQK